MQVPAGMHAVIDNPAVADWLRFQQFLECFYLDILGAKDYLLRFEWQHRGSPHVHGLAWLPGAPNVQLFTDPAAAEENRQQAIALSSPPPTLLFCQMVATCQKHLVLRRIHKSATSICRSDRP